MSKYILFIQKWFNIVHHLYWIRVQVNTMTFAFVLNCSLEVIQICLFNIVVRQRVIEGISEDITKRTDYIPTTRFWASRKSQIIDIFPHNNNKLRMFITLNNRQHRSSRYNGLNFFFFDKPHRFQCHIDRSFIILVAVVHCRQCAQQ